MFTGIIQDTGKIKSRIVKGKNTRLGILTGKDIPLREKGMSVAINGVCLTAVFFKGKKQFEADVTGETAEKTNIKKLKPGSCVNIEYPLAADEFLSGHIVQGHVDTMGKVLDIRKQAGEFILKISYPAEFAAYIIEKGSITVDGVSLTAFGVDKTSFKTAIIPETASSTIISKYKKGDEVNLEFDIIGKYVEKQINKRRK